MDEGGRQYRKTCGQRAAPVHGRSTSPCWTTRRRPSFVVDRVLEARERGIELRRQAVLFRSR